MNLAHTLVQQAEERPDQPALIHGRLSLSYAEFETRSAQLAARLKAKGLQKGDVVLICLGMGIPLYILLLALWRAGAHALFLDPGMSAADLDRVLQRVSPHWMIGAAKGRLWRWTRKPLRKLPYLWFSGKVNSSTANATPETLSPESPALITFTYGSTGVPKGLVRSHAFLATQLQLLQPLLNMQPGQRTLATLPVFALSNLASGMRTVIPTGPVHKPAAMNGNKIAACIRNQQIESITASPAFYEQLLAGTPAPLPSVRNIFVGGAAVFPSLMDRLARKFPEAEITAVYGSSEAEPIAEMTLQELTPDRRQEIVEGAGLYAGIPVDSIELRIVKNEIQVTGPQVLRGYLDGIGDAENKINENGKIWHRTGDAGRLDAEGGLWLLGRCSARQGTLFPFAVEAAAVACGGIQLAGLVEVHGKRILAVQPLPEQHPDAEKLNTLCRKHHLDTWTSLRLPTDRRHNAKVDYPALTRTLQKKGIPHGQ